MNLTAQSRRVDEMVSFFSITSSLEVEEMLALLHRQLALGPILSAMLSLLNNVFSTHRHLDKGPTF